MQIKLAGVKNGVELYVPVPENDAEKRELELREKRLTNFLTEIILKYYDRVADEMDSE